MVKEGSIPSPDYAIMNKGGTVRGQKEARIIARKLARTVEDKITIDVDAGAEVDSIESEGGTWVATWIFIPDDWSESNG